MNKVYRTVFNEKTNTWVAVAETAKAHGKSASGSVHGIAVGLLERVGIKIPRFAASTMLLVLTAAAGYAHAGPGIYINDGQDVNCTVLPDGSTAVPYAIQPGNPQQVSTPLQGVGNVSMYNAADVGLTSSYNPCNSRTTASSEAHDKQTNRTLFYGDKNHTASETENGAKNLTLGGRLDVNSGIIGLGDRGTNGTNATNSIRIGTGVTLDDANKQTNSIAIGVDTMATKASATALGAKAKAQLENSVALGSGSTTGVHASGVESATIGSVIYGGGANKFAGSTNIAAGDQVSIGSANNERQIKHVAAGAITASSTDAINGSQLFYVTQGLQNQIGAASTHYYSVKDTGSESSATSNYNNNGAKGNWSLAAGVWAQAAADDATAVGGKKAKALAKQSLAVGSDTKAEGVSSIAIGGDDLKFLKQASIDYYKVLTGDTGFHKDTFTDTYAKGEAAVAMGVQAQATGDWSMTLGVKSETNARSAVALGTGAKGKEEGVVALGAGSVADRAARAADATTSPTATVAAGNVYANANASNDAKKAVSATVKQVAGAPLGAVSVGNANNTRQITHVAAGTEDSDAVNVAQLKAVAEATATTTLLVGDGTGNNPAGKVIAPAAGNGNKLATAGDIANAINNSGFQATAGGNTVGDTPVATTVKPGQKVTFAAGDGLTVEQKVDTDGNQRYTYALAQTIDLGANGSVKTGNTKLDNSGITIAAPTPTNSTNTVSLSSSGLNNGGKKISNVAAGAADTDAVNKGQLDAAINNVSTVANKGWDIGNGTSAAVGTVKPGKKVDFVAGNGSTKVDVTQAATSGNFKVTVSAAPGALQYTGTNNAAGTNTPNADQFTPTDQVTLVGGASNTSGVTVNNVASAELSATSKQAVNGSQLHATNQNVANNAVNIAKGINFGGTTGSNNYRLGDTIRVEGDNNITSTTVAGGAQLALNPNLNVTSVTTTDAAGNKTVTNGSGVTITPASGNPVSLTTDGLNNGDKKITNVAAGTADTDAVNKGQLDAAINNVSTVANKGWDIGNGTSAAVGTVKPGKKVDFVAGNGSTKVDVTQAATSGNFKVTVSAAPGALQYTGTNNAAGTNTPNADQFTPTDQVTLVGGASNTSGVTVNNVASAELSATSKQAVNGSQLHATNQNVANNAVNIAKGINFGGTTGSNNYRLGDTIRVEGDNNITSTTVAGGAQLALNPNLNVTSVTTTDAAGNKTVTNGSGVTITPASGNPVSLTTDGLNNGDKKITNVAAGTAGTDAVNVSQLNQALGSISGVNTANFTALNNKVNEVAADAKAGTAAAMAVAGLPQAYLPGKSMMAVGGSVYRGESGYAIGYSTISDGGNWIVKGTATGNSRGHYGATVAVGYQW